MALLKVGQFLVLLVSIVVGCTISAATARAAPSLAVYGQLPGFEMAALSQSGERIALLGVMNDERRLVVLDKDYQPLLIAPLGDVKVRGLYWAGEDKVLVYKSDTRTLGVEFTAAKTELYSMIVVPLNKEKFWSVFAKQNTTITGGVSGFYGIRERDGKYFGYFGGITYEGNPQINGYLTSTDPVLYEVDLQTQAARKIAPRFDGDGHSRWIVGRDGEVSARLDYKSKSGDWIIRNHEGKRIAFGTNPLGDIGLVGLGATPGTLIYSKKDDVEEEWRWYELPFSGGEPKEIYQDVAVDRAIFDERTRQIVGYQQEGDVPSYKFHNNRQQSVVNGTMKAFPGVSVHLIDWNDRFDRLVVMTEGVGDPQTWWLVDIKTGQAKQLGTSYPMRSKDVAPMRMIQYKASDGMDIAAVLTLPPDVPAKSLPVIVLPHGGPGTRDYPIFDWWAQAFASRGYAVLQPNFRGSTGYGATFTQAGYGEWGRKMQSDISEGLEYLVNEGIADPKRACIMGASYGGYAALAGVTLQKGIYRCAVAVAGVSDVEKMVASDINERDWDATARRALKHEVGSGRDLRAVSPVNFAATADAPILLIHGKNDTVVHYDQSVDMQKALRKAGKPVEFVTLAGEDHWLSSSATRLKMLEAAMTFVAKHNPAGTPR